MVTETDLALGDGRTLHVYDTGADAEHAVLGARLERRRTRRLAGGDGDRVPGTVDRNAHANGGQFVLVRHRRCLRLLGDRRDLSVVPGTARRHVTPVGDVELRDGVPDRADHILGPRLDTGPQLLLQQFRGDRPLKARTAARHH